MCNLYNLKVRRWEIDEYFRTYEEWRDEVELEKDYVAPGRPGLVIRAIDGHRKTEPMRWGFPPPTGVSKPIVNVRNYSSPFWRTALGSPARRCLVPVTEFQEWSVERDPATGKQSQHWFQVPSRPLFAFAGVWRPTETGPAFAFLTCGYDGEAAHHVVGAVHPKAIPVILHDDDHDRWLHEPVEDVIGLACAYPSQLMEVRRG